ncbi:MAG TPA: hypothetical protein VNM72_07335 [Blastocatellia bacterium]|nr:hypothetical protein [Blastocatellia bacterium]
MKKRRSYIVGFGLAIALVTTCPYPGGAQESDEYLTPKEINQLKEAQEIDLRVKVLMKIAERRLLLLENRSAQQSKKEEEEWGPLPKASPATLLNHYVKAVDETIINIEDAHSREAETELLYKALKAFREATERHLARLTALERTLTSDEEKAALARALEAARLAHADASEGEKRLAEQIEKEKQERKKKPSSSS